MLILSKQMNKDLFYPPVVLDGFPHCAGERASVTKVNDYRNGSAEKGEPHTSAHIRFQHENCWKIAILCKTFSAPDDAYFLAELLRERVCISANYCRKFPL